jgi:hypothetical protein
MKSEALVLQERDLPGADFPKKEANDSREGREILHLKVALVEKHQPEHRVTAILLHTKEEVQAIRVVHLSGSRISIVGKKMNVVIVLKEATVHSKEITIEVHQPDEHLSGNRIVKTMKVIARKEQKEVAHLKEIQIDDPVQGKEDSLRIVAKGGPENPLNNCQTIDRCVHVVVMKRILTKGAENQLPVALIEGRARQLVVHAQQSPHFQIQAKLA